MKKAVGIILMSSLFTGCHDVRPSEIAATVVRVDPLMCGLCGGWFVQISSVTYRADIAAPYAKVITSIWIRYPDDERPSFKEMNWITVNAIRQQ